MAADELHEFGGIFKTAGRGLEFAAAGRVAAQGENVFAVQRADFFQQRAHFGAGVVDAGKMGEPRQPMLVLDAVHNMQRFVARAAAGAVGHGTIVGLGGQEGGNLLFQQGAVAFIRLGREKLKGNDGLSGRRFFGIDVADESHGHGLSYAKAANVAT